jgi:ribosomal protein S18 acetylase RimI-like enzyme
VEIRLIRPEECEALGRLTVAAYRAVSDEALSGGYAEELADVGRRSEKATVLVAVADAVEGAVVLGGVTYVPDAANTYAEDLAEGEAGIRMLAVDPDVQGRGVGRALLEACLARARAQGRRAVGLHSTTLMTAAHRLYEDVGFVRAPERDWSPGSGVELLGFRLTL